MRLRRETEIASCREAPMLQLIGKGGVFLNPAFVWFEMAGIECVDCI
jgi:hypothetical protein